MQSGKVDEETVGEFTGLTNRIQHFLHMDEDNTEQTLPTHDIKRSKEKWTLRDCRFLSFV